MSNFQTVTSDGLVEMSAGKMGNLTLCKNVEFGTWQPFRSARENDFQYGFMRSDYRS
jgi:hypothetical protein